MDKKIDELIVFKYLLLVFVAENCGIVLSILLAISAHVFFGVALLQEVYSGDVVGAQSVFAVLLLIAVIVLMFRRQVASSSRAILAIAMLALNIYLIFLCMFPGAPDGYTADTLYASSLRFIKLFAFGN